MMFGSCTAYDWLCKPGCAHFRYSIQHCRLHLAAFEMPGVKIQAWLSQVCALTAGHSCFELDALSGITLSVWTQDVSSACLLHIILLMLWYFWIGPDSTQATVDFFCRQRAFSSIMGCVIRRWLITGSVLCYSMSLANIICWYISPEGVLVLQTPCCSGLNDSV